MSSADELVMLDDDEDETVSAQGSWHILVVDDDLDVHAATEFSLTGASIAQKPLRFTHANSGAEAINLLQQLPDVDLVLLDMVMERQDSGLEVARWLREVAGRSGVPTVLLRSGQPGMLARDAVLSNPHINAFIEKQHATRAVLLDLLTKMLLDR